MNLHQEVVSQGLLRFPPAGTTFPGRRGGGKDYVLDTRGAGTNLELRRLIVSALQTQAESCPPFHVVVGLAKSGTTWAAWLAWAMEIPFANVLLDGKRTSGLQREVEGDVAGKRILLIDNWTNSGDSIRKASEVVKRAGGTPVAALTIARNSDLDLGLPFRSVWEIEDLLAVAEREGLYVRPERTTPTQAVDMIYTGKFSPACRSRNSGPLSN